MKNVLVIFGGQSAEHEVSIQSARMIISALDKTQYNPILVAISRTGCWYLLPEKNIPDDYIECTDNMPNLHLCHLIKMPNETVIYTHNNQTITVNVVFPIIHGPMGEDGVLQGLLEMMLVPYVGSSVLGSAVSMDKETFKRILMQALIPVVPYVKILKHSSHPNYQEICDRLQSKVLFVKPSAMGSSIGVTKIQNKTQYEKAICEAFEYDSKILIEKFIAGREVECSVLGNYSPVASCIGEIKSSSEHQYYSYDAKYIDRNSTDLIIPASLPSDLENKIRSLAIKTFLIAECKCLARVDFFISSDNHIYVNELNTMPGFTSISMYPKLWQASGMPLTKLISKLLRLAEEQFIEKQLKKIRPNIPQLHQRSEPSFVM